MSDELCMRGPLGLVSIYSLYRIWLIVNLSGKLKWLSIKIRRLCEVLLNAEAQVNAADKNGFTPLCAAAAQGHFK